MKILYWFLVVINLAGAAWYAVDWRDGLGVWARAGWVSVLVGFSWIWWRKTR